MKHKFIDFIDPQDILPGYLEIKETPFVEGFHRVAYMHPENDERLLKIVKRTLSTHRKSSRQHKGQEHYLDPNINEYLSYKDLIKNGINVENCAYFAKLIGWVETSEGVALVKELHKSDDGSTPEMLRHMLKPKSQRKIDKSKRARILELIDQFYDFCIDHSIMNFSWRPENIGFITQNDVLKLVSVDIKTQLNREFIPLSTYIPLFHKQKVKRRIERYREHIKKNLN